MSEDDVDTRIVAWREAAICLGFTEGPDQISETGASERGMSSDRLMFDESISRWTTIIALSR